jgi:hypothetical protein
MQKRPSILNHEPSMFSQQSTRDAFTNQNISLTSRSPFGEKRASPINVASKAPDAEKGDIDWQLLEKMKWRKDGP